MLVWIVLGALVVRAVVVLAVVAHGTLGAYRRLERELAAAGREVAPVRAQVQQSAGRAARLRDDRATAG